MQNFRSEVNFVVCDGCEVTRYCTFKCRDEAKQYHQWECGSNLPEHVGIAWLGLRVALAGEACEASGDESKIEAYQKVCSLLTHIADMTAEDKLQYSLVRKHIVRHNKINIVIGKVILHLKNYLFSLNL